MDTNSFINQVKSYRKSTLDKALQLNSFANGGPVKPYVGASPQIDITPITNEGVTIYPMVKSTDIGANYNRGNLSVGTGLSMNTAGGRWQAGPYSGKMTPEVNVTPYLTGGLDIGNNNNKIRIGGSLDFKHTPSLNIGITRKFDVGGPTNQIPPYITSDYDEYVSRKQAEIDSAQANRYTKEFNEYFPGYLIDEDRARYMENKYLTPTDDYSRKIFAQKPDGNGITLMTFKNPRVGKMIELDYSSKVSDKEGYHQLQRVKPFPAPVQKVIYQEKPKTFNYEVSRDVQYPNTQSARIWRILTNNNEYNLNPNEEDYPVDPRYKGINDTVTEVEKNAWNQRFNIEPYTKEMTDEEAAELEKQGFTVKKKKYGGPIRQFQEGGPTENYFGEVLPTVTVHPQDNTRVSNTPYINPVYDEDSNKYLTGRPYSLYAKELDWNDYINNGYFFGINPNNANKHFTDSPKGAFLKAYEMNPNINGLYGYIFEHTNDYDRFVDNNPKPLDLNLTNGKINKTLQGRTITEDLKNSIQSAAKKYNVDPYDILAHFFLEANDTIIDNNTYPNLHDTRYLQVRKQSPALGEFFINPEEKDLAANMRILQKDGTYDQQKLMKKVSEELPKLKNIPVSESYADEVAWMIANDHRDFNPKQKGYRAPKGKINHSYIEMLDDAIPILKQTKLFD